MNPLQQMEITEKSARTGRPPENVRRSRMTAATSNTRVAASPKVEKNSGQAGTDHCQTSCLLPGNSAERAEEGNDEKEKRSPSEAHAP